MTPPAAKENQMAPDVTRCQCAGRTISKTQQADPGPSRSEIPPAVFDIAGTAAYLSTTERHVTALWQRREIPGIKVGALVRFRRTDLDRWLDARVVGL